ncbi:MAG: hypothetical protein ABGZ36_04105 [Actinomycetota bacterium]
MGSKVAIAFRVVLAVTLGSPSTICPAYPTGAIRVPMQVENAFNATQMGTFAALCFSVSAAVALPAAYVEDLIRRRKRLRSLVVPSLVWSGRQVERRRMDLGG